MSLKLILGASGSGKSSLLYDTVLGRAKDDPGRRFIVLVPEQNTLQTQKDLVGKSERGGILNIDVLSFTRLAYRVFEQTGVARRQVLSETGKVLLLRLIAAREGDRISMIGPVLDKPGVLGEVKSILSELDQYGIGQDRLLEMEQEIRDAGGKQQLAQKLSELRTLQEAYERYQADHFITGEKILRVLCEKALLDDSLEGAQFFLDGYTGFTPAQLDVLGVLLKRADEITVTITVDPGAIAHRGNVSLGDVMFMKPGDENLFALPVRTIQSLVSTAEEAGVKVEPPVVLDGKNGRHKDGSALNWLEKHFLRPGKYGNLPFPGKDTQQQIFLRQCADPYDEAMSAAVTITELAKSGVRYREIALICGSMKEYAQYVQRVLELYEIPYFIDHSTTVVMNPAFEFVQSAIDVLEHNFSYESVMALLRTALTEEENDSADILENYVLAAGIRGHKAWSGPFLRQTRKKNEKLMMEAEIHRAHFMERFEPFADVMKKGKAPVKEYATAVWKLILDFEVPQKLAALSARCEQDRRMERAREYASAAGVIANVLDEAVLLIGDEKVTRRQFSDILRAGFAEAKIGLIPPSIDQVQVGDMRRTRLEHIRVVLFLGLNDSFVPERRARGGLLTDMEREYLRGKKVRLAPTAREDANIQQFYLYLALTKPSDKLYLSWSLSRRDGETLRPSYVLRNLKRLFPDAPYLDAASAAPFETAVSKRTGAVVLSRALSEYAQGDEQTAQEIEPKLRELLNIYRGKDLTWEESSKALLDAAGTQDGETAIDKRTAEELYGSVLSGNITRLEEFAQCPFHHFAQFGLRLSEREEFAVKSFDIGNLLHAAVEIFSAGLSRRSDGITWRNISDQERDTLADQALEKALSEGSRDLYMDNGRSRSILGRCRMIFRRSVRTIQEQIKAGLFVPARFELRFGEGEKDSVRIDTLSGGHSMQLRGRIDRIDECDDTENGKLYVKVVDYKSSRHDLRLEDLIAGEQLQLLVYLDAAARIEKEAHPDREIVCAGIFYYEFQDPVIQTEQNLDAQELEDTKIRQMRVTGLVNSSSDVVQRLDTTLEPGSTSRVVPVRINKKTQEASDDKNVVTSKQIDVLRTYTRLRMSELAESIYSGKIAPQPSRKNDDQTACRFCPYSDVCGFDPHRRDMGYRESENRDLAENWEIINGAVEAAGTKPGQTGADADALPAQAAESTAEYQPGKMASVQEDNAGTRQKKEE